MKTSQLSHPAVVSYMSHSGLAIVRSLGKRKIPVYAVDPNERQIGMNSRYCHPLVCPSIENEEANHVEFLISLAKTLGTKPVLYPTGDNGLLCYAKYEDQLKDYFIYTNDKKETVNSVVPKIAMYETAIRFNFDVPKSFIPKSRDQLREAYQSMEKPFLIKPTHSNTWYSRHIAQLVSYQKCLIIETYEELLRWYDILSELNNEIIISEIVPGEDSDLFYVPSYRTADGKILGMYVGQKVRVLPVHFGCASYVEVCTHEHIIEKTKEILAKLNYFGLSGIEYKYDYRSDTYKLIEINARYGLWDCLGEAIGIDLAHIAYCDVLNIDNEKEAKNINIEPNKQSWLCFERDLEALRLYKKERLITFGSWLKTLLRISKYSVLDVKDMRPFVRVSMEFFLRYLKLVTNKIFSFGFAKAPLKILRSKP